ncbi:hypothetical protein QQZ08_008462 [Neonectria magnoliae]|uniref:Uncharacterized protein n=1 Tax=Neonectria magnoliae TaxID=2732573 RepID=A0ABR1HVI5_9HYPO
MDLRFVGLKVKNQIKWAHFRIGKMKDRMEYARHVNDSVIALSQLKTQQKIHEMSLSDWSEASPSVVPLSHCLQRKSFQPDLVGRLALARAVVETAYQLHAVDWLYKALRAVNIFLFERVDGVISHTKPRLSRFELARPASQPNLIPEVDRGRKEDDFYHRPSMQLCNPDHRSYPYCKDFDLHSLVYC